MAPAVPEMARLHGNQRFEPTRIVVGVAMNRRHGRCPGAVGAQRIRVDHEHTYTARTLTHAS